jgi:hypothetical protein
LTIFLTGVIFITIYFTHNIESNFHDVQILVGLESLLENARFLKAEFIDSFVLRRKK